MSIPVNASQGQSGQKGKDIPGNMGNEATFHSMKPKAMKERPPIMSIVITIGESHGKYDPPPEIGMRRKMIPIDDARTPDQSIRPMFSRKRSFRALFGIRKYPTTADSAARGEIIQKKPRHVERIMKAAAMNGPMIFPRPRDPPRMP